MSGLLILTEGGEKIGFGHISRCSAIINAYKQNGGYANMLVDWQGDVPDDFEYEIVAWHRDDTIMVEYDMVLVDSYLASLEDIARLKTKFRRIFAIDDYGRFLDYNADLIVNPNIYAQNIPYTASFKGGKEYIILREAFRLSTDKAMLNNETERILITMGGSDYRSLLPRFANVFSSLPFQFDFLCGSNNSAADLTAAYSAHENYTFYGFLPAETMKAQMLKADIAISACGQTLHELSFLGIPTIGVVIDKDQEYNSVSYLDANVLHARLYWDDENLEQEVLNAVTTLLPYERRKHLMKNALTLIDGKGIERIVDAIRNVA